MTARGPAAGDRTVADPRRLPSHTDDDGPPRDRRHRRSLGPARRRRPLVDADAGVARVDLLHAAARVRCRRHRAPTGTGPVTSSTRTCVTPTSSRSGATSASTSVRVPYRDTSVEYPVLTGAFMWTTGELTRGVHALDQTWSELVVFGLLTALLLGACGLVVTGATARAAGHRPYDAAIFALSPLLVFHAFSNWDLFAMALTAARCGRGPPGGRCSPALLVGLGTAAKLYPVLLLVPLWLLAVRTRRFGGAGWATAAAVGSWLAVNVPLALAYHTAGRSSTGSASTARPNAARCGRSAARWSRAHCRQPTARTGCRRVRRSRSMFALGLLVVAALALLAPRKPRVGTAGLPRRARLPAHHQGVEPAVLTVAGAAARTGPSALAALTGVAVHRDRRVVRDADLLLGLDPQASAHGVTYGWLVLVLAAAMCCCW